MNKRTIIFAILGLLGVAIGYVVYTMLTTKNHSPQAIVTTSMGDLDMEVVYCRPYKKGRLVFGTKEESALQPYGVYWRAGANEATTISFNQDVVFGGKSLNAGKYVLYAVPNKSTWTIGINSEWERWGYLEVDHAKDILQVQVPAEQLDTVVEQLTIDLSQAEEQITLNLKWDQTSVSVPISVM